MYKNRFFMKLGVFLFALFLLSGCGSNNSQGIISNSPSVPDTNTTSTIAKLSIVDGGKVASENAETISIVVRALTKHDTLATGLVLAQYQEDGDNNGNLASDSSELSNGFATFTYTAPQDLQNQIDKGNTGTSFKFYSAEDTSITTMVSIVFDTTGESEGGGGNPIASLTVSNGDMILSQDAEAVTVNILATDSDGAPLQSGTIRVRYPEDAVRVGLFSTDEVTINSGIASFSYIGPDPIYYRYRSFPYVGEDDLVVFSFEYKENPTYVADWEVSFIPEVEPIEPPAPTYRIASLAANEDITVTTDGEEPTIKVLAFMSGNVPVPEGTVSVIYPPDVATKNIGTFSPAKAEIVDGIATFTYTGPTPLIADVSQTFTFRATNYPTATDTMSVNYAPQIDIDNPIANTLIIMNDSDNNISNGNTIEITKYSEVVNVKVRVYGVDNNPFDGGNVKVQYPDIILSGTDVGSFASLSVPCVNGVADFIYTAPSNLQDRTDSFEFTFSHDSEGSPATSSLEMTMNPETGQIVITTYELHMLPADGNNTMGLESIKVFTTMVLDAEGAEVSEGNYTITNLNPLIGDILDTNNTVWVNPPLSAIEKNNVNFRVQSDKRSGVLPVQINVTFVDVNGQVQNLEEIFNIVIFSGPPTAMSISYVSTGQDEAHSQFIEEFSVKLTDKYNNPVNTQPMIQVGAIAGYAKDATIYPAIKNEVDSGLAISQDFTNNGLYNGNLIALRNDADISNYSASQSQIEIGNTVDYDITNLDTYNNILVSFGNGYVYHKSGKWDIDSADSGTDILIVDEKYDDVSTGFDMGFAIGNNFRQDTCRFAQEWVLTTESEDGTYKVDINGYAKIKMPYDYYLVGKDVIVYANLVGDVLGSTDKTLRVGEAKKVTLRGHELEAIPNAGWVVPAASVDTYAFTFRLKDTVEWYRNANLGRIIYKATGDGVSCALNSVTDYRNCGNGGLVTAYIDCTNTAADAGSVTMEDSIVGTELTH